MTDMWAGGGPRDFTRSRALCLRPERRMALSASAKRVTHTIGVSAQSVSRTRCGGTYIDVAPPRPPFTHTARARRGSLQPPLRGRGRRRSEATSARPSPRRKRRKGSTRSRPTRPHRTGGHTSRRSHQPSRVNCALSTAAPAPPARSHGRCPWSPGCPTC